MISATRASRFALVVNYAAIAVVASALADVVHEILGHLAAAWIIGDQIISISTVAIQSASESRLVAGAGTSANVVVGALALVMVNAPMRGAKTGRNYAGVFLWLFATFNLLNCGYLVVSAVVGSGDWAVVIKGLIGAPGWRIALGFVGSALYVGSLQWLTRSMAVFINRQGVPVAELRLLVATAYVAGGAVMTLASVFNPISPGLILVSGIGASFGLFAGMLLISGKLIWRYSLSKFATAPPVPSGLWITLAIFIGGAFTAVLGPGIRLAKL